MPGRTVERGYGTPHRTERARLNPIVQAGQAYCQQPRCIMRTRWIPPGTPWALGHNDTRTAWIGPTHAACNQRDGASKGGRIIAARHRHGWHPTPWHSRNW